MIGPSNNMPMDTRGKIAIHVMRARMCTDGARVGVVSAALISVAA